MEDSKMLFLLALWVISIFGFRDGKEIPVSPPGMPPRQLFSSYAECEKKLDETIVELERQGTFKRLGKYETETLLTIPDKSMQTNQRWECTEAVWKISSKTFLEGKEVTGGPGALTLQDEVFFSTHAQCTKELDRSITELQNYGLLKWVTKHDNKYEFEPDVALPYGQRAMHRWECTPVK
jgi:hypothetical protein